MAPIPLRGGIEPDQMRIGVGRARHPGGAALRVPVLHRAAGLADLIGAHGGVAHEHRLVVAPIGVQHLGGRLRLGVTARIVAPHPLVQAVVEVEELQVLELGSRSAEQLFAQAHIAIHGAADVQEQQHLDRVAPLRPHDHVQIALARGAGHGGVQVQLVGGAGAGESAQPAQGHLDVARAQLDGVVQVFELAALPHLDRAALPPGSTDADAFRVVAAVAEGAGPARADPFGAALVALLLLGQPLAQRLHQLVEAAQRLDLRLLLLGKGALGQLAQPVLGDLRLQRRVHPLKALEHMGEHPVEAVQVALVLDQGGARQVVEAVHRQVGHAPVHRLHQHEVLAQRHGRLGVAQLGEQAQEHGG